MDGARVDGTPADGGGRLHPARRWALRGYAALPLWLRLQLVRRLTPDYTVGALCLLESQGRLLMLRQHHREGWTLPGGLLERGEAADDGVRREVAEETGLRIDPGEPLTCVVDPVTQRVDVLYHVPVGQPPAVTARSEAVTAAWMAPDQLGELDDSTAQALAAYVRILRPDARVGRLLGPAPAEDRQDPSGA